MMVNKKQKILSKTYEETMNSISSGSCWIPPVNRWNGPTNTWLASTSDTTSFSSTTDTDTTSPLSDTCSTSSDSTSISSSTSEPLFTPLPEQASRLTNFPFEDRFIWCQNPWVKDPADTTRTFEKPDRIYFPSYNAFPGFRLRKGAIPNGTHTPISYTHFKLGRPEILTSFNRRNENAKIIVEFRSIGSIRDIQYIRAIAVGENTSSLRYRNYSFCLLQQRYPQIAQILIDTTERALHAKPEETLNEFLKAGLTFNQERH